MLLRPCRLRHRPRASRCPHARRGAHRQRSTFQCPQARHLRSHPRASLQARHLRRHPRLRRPRSPWARGHSPFLRPVLRGARPALAGCALARQACAAGGGPEVAKRARSLHATQQTARCAWTWPACAGGCRRRTSSTRRRSHGWATKPRWWRTAMRRAKQKIFTKCYSRYIHITVRTCCGQDARCACSSRTSASKHR